MTVRSNFLQASSPFGSRESLSSMAADSKADSRSLHEEHMVAALGNWVTMATNNVKILKRITVT